MLKTIVQYAFCLICWGYVKGASTIKCVNASIVYSQNDDVDSVKALVQNTVFLWWPKGGENIWTKGV